MFNIDNTEKAGKNDLFEKILSGHPVHIVMTPELERDLEAYRLSRKSNSLANWAPMRYRP